MKRIVISSVFVVLFVVLSLILFQRVGWANNFSFNEIYTCQTEDPNDPNAPEPEVCCVFFQAVYNDEEPNEPNEPEDDEFGLGYTFPYFYFDHLSSDPNDPNDPNEPEPGLT